MEAIKFGHTLPLPERAGYFEIGRQGSLSLERLKECCMNRRGIAALLFLFLASEALAQEKAPKVIDGWGNVASFKRDCKITPDEGKLTITVPGTPHNLNKVISDLSAPRVLQEVEGDFTIQVKVSGDFNPSPVSTVAPRGKAYNGAGLLLWVDDDLFVRLERNIWMNGPVDAQCHPPLFEVMVKGAPTGTSPPPTAATFFGTPATWFRLARSGDSVTPSYSHNGIDWTTAGAATLRLPKKVSVGVAAVNTSKKQFKAVFEELQLTTK